jgi:hypothetical protein
MPYQTKIERKIKGSVYESIKPSLRYMPHNFVVFLKRAFGLDSAWDEICNSIQMCVYMMI